MMDQSASFNIELLPAPKFKRSFAKSECVFEVRTDCIGRKVQFEQETVQTRFSKLWPLNFRV